MPKFSKGHNSGKIWWFFFFFWFIQVIYSSSPISWPSFKPLAQIIFEISCWQDFILIFSKGHDSRKGENSDKTKIRVCYFSWGIHIGNFKTLACTVRKIGIRFHSDFFQKGITSEREITQTRKKIQVSYFSMRNPYMKFQNPSMHGAEDMASTKSMTNGQTTNMPCQLLRSWGHIKKAGYSKCSKISNTKKERTP